LPENHINISSIVFDRQSQILRFEIHQRVLEPRHVKEAHRVSDASKTLNSLRGVPLFPTSDEPFQLGLRGTPVAILDVGVLPFALNKTALNDFVH
jgi:hypothetical protein